jgi:HK97 family phage prohead protease
MKSSLKLAEFTPLLPAEMQEGLDTALKAAELQPELHRAVSIAELVPKEERTFVGYASTRSMDRDNEVILPGGMDLSQFRKAPVLLFGHKWSELPIGKDLLTECDGYGIKTRSQMSETTFAKEVWISVKDGSLSTSSIGFIPTEWVGRNDKEFGTLMDMARKWPEWNLKDEPKGFITKALLLEHSLVAVPANIDALVTCVKKFNLTELGKRLHVDKKEMSPPTPPPPPEPVKTYHCLVKTPEQLHLESELEIAAMVARELKFQRGQL